MRNWSNTQNKQLGQVTAWNQEMVKVISNSSCQYLGSNKCYIYYCIIVCGSRPAEVALCGSSSDKGLMSQTNSEESVCCDCQRLFIWCFNLFRRVEPRSQPRWRSRGCQRCPNRVLRKEPLSSGRRRNGDMLRGFSMWLLVHVTLWPSVKSYTFAA